MTARRLRKTLIALVVAMLAALGASATAQAAPGLPGPFDDSFYTPPAPIPSGNPGDIVRWRPSVALLNLANVDAWEVMYLSTGARGQRDVVTGTVLVPKNVNPATAPIAGFAVGTQGPAFKCTASKAIERGTLYDQAAVDRLLSNGYAVAITDYDGYSPTTTPSYTTGQSEGPAVIDAVRAAQRLPVAGLSSGAKVVFQGYSQGGGAAMWAAEKQAGYAPELNLVGVAAGGVPGDLNAVAAGLDGGLGFGFLAFSAIGLDAAYPDLNLDSYLNDTGRTELNKAKQDACVVELLTNYAFKKTSDFTTTNPLPTPRWQARLAENKLGNGTIRVPVFQYHAAFDEIVATPQAEALMRTYCAKGVNLTWKTYVAEHALGLVAGEDDAFAFLQDRIAGRPATSTC